MDKYYRQLLLEFSQHTIKAKKSSHIFNFLDTITVWNRQVTIYSQIPV